MAKDEREFQHESLQNPSSIVKYLEAVAEGIRNGTIRLSNQDGDIVLEPRGLMNFEVRATTKRGRVALTLQCRWKLPEDGESDSGELQINGQE